MHTLFKEFLKRDEAEKHYKLTYLEKETHAVEWYPTLQFKYNAK